MRRLWLIAAIAFTVVTGGLTAAFVRADRGAVLRSVEERTAAMARLIVAHAEAALEDGNKLFAALAGPLSAWDLVSPEQGRFLFDTMRSLTAGSPYISSAWVMDGRGLSVLDTWTYPPKPIDGSDRPYFKAHLAGAADPVILGDTRPGAITGRQRFTFSRALRNPDGTIRAVMVVGVYGSYFAALYAEAATWPGAHAGLYSFDGGVLSRLDQVERASPAFTAEMERLVRAEPFGSRQIEEEGELRIASWRRSERFPALYGTSSQALATALEAWRERTFALAAASVAAVLGFWAFAFYASRALAAREAAAATDLALREVHHRVKNSLQLITGFLALRRRQVTDAAVRDELARVAEQIDGIADVHELLQGASALDEVDLSDLLRRLSRRLATGAPKELAFHGEEGVTVEASTGATAGIIVNELVTNALKHSRSRVAVHCVVEGDTIAVLVEDDGPGLPPGFEIDRTSRFGLRTAKAIAARLGGALAPVPRDRGAALRLTLPRHRRVVRLADRDDATSEAAA